MNNVVTNTTGGSSALVHQQVSNDETLLHIWLKKDKSDRTQKHYKREIKRFLGWMQNNGLHGFHEVRALHLLAYADWLPDHWADQTFNQAIATVKSLFSFACDEMNYIPLNPGVVLTLRTPEPVLPERILTRDEVQAAIKKAWNDDARLFIQILFGTGIRASEALNLRWSDLSEMNGSPRITVRNGKGGKTRVISCFASSWQALKAAPRPNELIFDVPYISAYRWVKEAFERSGKRHVSPHWLRHCAAITMRQAGMDWPAIARQLGHRDPSITLKAYAHLVDSDLDALQSL